MRNTKLKVISLLILVAFPTTAKRSGGGNPTPCSPCVLSLVAKDWELSTWVSSVPTIPVKDTSTGALEFSFPQASTNTWAAYLTYYTAKPYDISANHTLSTTVQVDVTGSPTFNYMSESFNTCVVPASARPMIWGAGTTALPDGRWWSDNVVYTIVPGTDTLTVSLDPNINSWSNSNGQIATEDADTLAAFQAALKSTQYLALTFGGGCYYGHGVNVSGGTAEFTLLTYGLFK